MLPRAFEKSIRGRRDFLQVGSAGLLGLSLGDLLGRQAARGAENPAPRARNVIMLFLTGGPATIDMWDMKPAAPETIRGEFRPVDTSAPGVQICEHLPRLASQMHLATLVRSATHTIAEHGQGTAYVMTGNRPSPAADYPSLGALSAALLKANRGTPAYMTVGTVPSSGAGHLGATLNPFEVSLADGRTASRIGLPEGFTITDLDRRQAVLERLDRRLSDLGSAPLSRQLQSMQRDALDSLRSDKINQALDLEREPEPIRKQYGPTFAGRGALAARRLIEAGARFVTIGFGDWDTHLNNFTRLRTSLLPELDQALGALLADLAERGLLDETIVYCTGEFGRTPHVNVSVGRDHWSRTMTALLAGGGFRRGFVYGATDETGSEPERHPCSPDDVSASIFRQLGFSPSHHVQTRSGRPISLFQNGRPLDEIVG
ncbi:MAG: DUF1501 domain-containing protein [Planctomycetales bacterium]